MGFLTPRWFIATLVGALVTLVFIWLIKKGANKFNVPVVKDIANDI